MLQARWSRWPSWEELQRPSGLAIPEMCLSFMNSFVKDGSIFRTWLGALQCGVFELVRSTSNDCVEGAASLCSSVHDRAASYGALVGISAEANVNWQSCTVQTCSCWQPDQAQNFLPQNCKIACEVFVMNSSSHGGAGSARRLMSTWVAEAIQWSMTFSDRVVESEGAG